MRAGLDLVEADDGAQQHRLAGARAADHAQHFAAIDVEIEMIVQELVAEAVDQAAHLDDDFLVPAALVFSRAPLMVRFP